ncbi:MAG: ABC transporter permease [Deltaproteobacteria bacterium]|nr:ABC transporter permease [Deltaproteobacteria bacterium]
MIRSSPMSILGLSLILIIVSLALFSPWIATHDPFRINFDNAFQPPSAAHWLGTDDLGRDVFSRIVYGSRISLKIAFVVVSLAATLGTALGVVSGYVGGLIDTIIMRIVDTFLAIPAFILAMVATAALGPSLTNVMAALALTWWTWYARIVRGEVLKLKTLTFITAEKSLGARLPRILFRHLVPNCVGPVAVQTTLQLGLTVLVSAALSFLGLGAQPPMPAWGLMIATGRQYLPDQWWMTTFPGITIFLLVMGFILVGDTIRDVLSRDIQ